MIIMVWEEKTHVYEETLKFIKHLFFKITVTWRSKSTKMSSIIWMLQKSFQPCKTSYRHDAKAEILIDRNWKFAKTEMNLNFGSKISMPKPKPKFREKMGRNQNLNFGWTKIFIYISDGMFWGCLFHMMQIYEMIDIQLLATF